MSIQSARDALDLVGKLVRPRHGTERWAFANGRPAVGRVVNVHIPNLDHTYVVCEFPSDTAFLCPFEVEVITN